jgi:MoxR-like ATPase
VNSSVLAESAVTIPELGTQKAILPPVTVLTSNGTRDRHHAFKRRCLYRWIAYPDTARVAEIIRRRVPASGDQLVARRGALASVLGTALHAAGLPVGPNRCERCPGR